MAMLRTSESAGDLWAKASELERDFAGYKRRLAERRACAAAVLSDGAEEEERSAGGEGNGRGRRYEEYVRRRDERLRHEWRARMERKEAEMKALWARLDRVAGSRSRRGGELPAASHGREQDHVNPQQKPGSLDVKVKPIAPVTTPRCSPSPKLTRPRTSVPSSPAAASPRLSTPDARRRPSHLHRQLSQAEPPATPRKENRLPPTASAPSTTPRPRTALSRSRSMMLKDRSCSSGRDSPRPPRFHPPRTSCDGVGNVKEPALLPDHDDAIVVMQSRPSFSEDAAVFAHLKKACAAAAAPEPFYHGRSGGDGAEPASSPLVTSKDEPDCSKISPASSNADSKSNNDGAVHRSSESDKAGSPDITGDSDTEPSYVYIKRDSGEQISQVSASPGTCPQVELLSEDRGSCNFEGATTSEYTIAGESPMVDAEEASRRASSESLYSNVRSSFSQRSELDISATNSPLRSPPSCTTPPSNATPVDDTARPKKKPEEDNAENNPRSSVTVSITVQSPMDAMSGLKRFLTFGKKNDKVGEADTTVVKRPLPNSLGPATPAGASDNLDSSYAISPHVPSLQSFTPSSHLNHELKEVVLQAKSTRVHRSFFSLSSFKSRAS